MQKERTNVQEVGEGIRVATVLDPFMGDVSQNWLIMKSGDHLIGLFQGLFDKNIMTFNPGWDSNAQKIDKFTDVRDLQRQLKAKGVKFQSEGDEKSSGPASFMMEDPDGNSILVDQKFCSVV